MKFKNFWLNNTIKIELNKAYNSQNISKMETYRIEGYDLLKMINLKEHPLIDSINKQLIKNIKYFLINYTNEKLLEEAFILVKKNKNIEIEKLIIVFCKNKKIKLSHFSSEYRTSKIPIKYSKKFQ